MRIGRFQLDLTVLDVLLVFVPGAIVLRLAGVGDVWIFAAACLAIIPLAGWMGRSTEHLASHYGAGIGGLLNATFGNAAEMIIALFALREGLHGIVKASLTGSIIGNVLLVLGLSVLCGGLRHRRQTFNRTAIGLGATLLALSAVGLVVPAIFHLLASGDAAGAAHEQDLSLAIAVVLFVAYAFSLVFSLRTHSDLFGGDDHGTHGEPWSKRRSIIVLVAATALVALMSELLVKSVEHAAETVGMSKLFVGVILVAVIGNAAEHSSAILMAMRNKMDLAMHIAIGSGIQIALFVAPLLVFVSYAFDPSNPLNLLFSHFEVIAVVLSVFVVALVAHDGESHWMEGVLLLAVYVILGIAFFYL
ncbi:MAG: calcium/proton exchanger [Planctomycetes bacterium]|nr:calcium/proton exchanger [Planctomycetota bacterium]